jgi:hypothetical protein
VGTERGAGGAARAASVVAQPGRGGEATAHRGPETGRHAVAAGNYWRAPPGAGGRQGQGGEFARPRGTHGGSRADAGVSGGGRGIAGDC